MTLYFVQIWRVFEDKEYFSFFYRTVFNGIVVTNGVWMVVQVGGQQEKACLDCTSETMRYKMLIIGTLGGGVGMQHHGVTLI